VVPITRLDLGRFVFDADNPGASLPVVIPDLDFPVDRGNCAAGTAHAFRNVANCHIRGGQEHSDFLRLFVGEAPSLTLFHDLNP
jgi:hypothetical protein